MAKPGKEDWGCDLEASDDSQMAAFTGAQANTVATKAVDIKPYLISKAREPLSLISDEEVGDILTSIITSSAEESASLRAKLMKLYKESEGAKDAQSASIETGSISTKTLKENELKCFLYQLIHKSLGKAGRSESVHYAELSYNARESVEKAGRESNPASLDLDKSVDAADYYYNYARSLEIRSPNSREMRMEAYKIYCFVKDKYKSLFSQDREMPPYVCLSTLRALVIEKESFENILESLASMRVSKMFSYMIPLINAQEAWVKLCLEAGRFKAGDDNPRLQKFLDYIKLKSSQEFLFLKKEEIAEDEKRVLVAGSPEEKMLLDLAARYEALQNNPLVSSKGVNMLIVDKSAELSRILASKADYPRRYLESLAKNDNEALFDFYLNYDEPVYEPVSMKEYKIFAQKPRRYFLEAAAWSGNSKAQYIAANQYLREARELLEKISKEKNEEVKKTFAKDLDIAKERWHKFLVLAANNENVNAKFDLANSIALGRDSRNCDNVDFFPYGKEGLEYKYYIEAAALGHEGAKAKMVEMDEKIKGICANLEAMTPQNLKYLSRMVKYNESYRKSILPIIASCFLHGYGVKKSVERGLEMLNMVYNSLRGARENIAIYYYNQGSFEGFERLLRDVRYRLEALDILDAKFKEPKAVDLKGIFQTILKVKEFYKELARNNDELRKVKSDPLELQKLIKQNAKDLAEIKKFIEKSTKDLAVKGLVEAKIEMADKVIKGTNPGDKNDLDSRQEALRILMPTSNASDDEEATIAKQILSLLKTENILPADLSVAEIDRFFQPNFLIHQPNLASKLRFELAQHIERFAKQKTGEEKVSWDERVVTLLRLGANSTFPSQFARERIVSRIFEEGYRANIDDLSEIGKWYESFYKSSIKKPLDMARRVYDIGLVVENDLEKRKYIKEFSFYFNLANREEKEVLQRECSAWAAIAFEAAKPKAPAVEVKKSSAQPKAATVVEAKPNLAKAGEGKQEGKEEGGKEGGVGKSVRKDKKKRLKKLQKRAEAAAAALKAEASGNSDEDEEVDQIVEVAAEVDAKATQLEETQLKDLASTSLQEKVEDLDAKKLQPAALESAKKLALRQEHGKQMRAFLDGPRTINSIKDLPDFLQKIWYELPSSGEYFLFFLKGSAVYASPECARKPSDLDCEFHIKEMDTWKDGKIKEFIVKYFDIDEGLINIYRNSRFDIFTVNAKDAARGIDLSFYSDKKLPPENLGWTTSRESRIKFSQEGVAQKIKPEGFLDYCKKEKIFIPDHALVINPKARGLILRLCLLNTIGEVGNGELNDALSQATKENPVMLFIRELGIEGGSADKKVRGKIFNFLESHSIEGSLRNIFIANLLTIIDIELLPPCEFQEDSQPQRLYEYQEGYFVNIEYLREVLEVVRNLTKEFPIAKVEAPSSKPALVGDQSQELSGLRGRGGAFQNPV